LCHILFIVMLSVILLNVIMLYAIILSGMVPTVWILLVRHNGEVNQYIQI